MKYQLVLLKYQRRCGDVELTIGIIFGWDWYDEEAKRIISQSNQTICSNI